MDTETRTKESGVRSPTPWPDAPTPTRGGPGGFVSGESTPVFVLLVATSATLLVLGLVMSFSASFVRSAAETGDAFGIFSRQLLWCAVGMVLIVPLALTDYHRWRRFAVPLLAVALIACAAVLVPEIGDLRNGARRWLSLGPVGLQPAEMTKLALALALSHLIARRWTRIRSGDLHALLMPALPLMVTAALLILVEPDLETAVLVLAIGGTVLYVAGLPGRILAVGVGGAFLGAAASIASSGFRRGRILAWLDPVSDASNFGYQQLQGFIALGSGGLFGVGLGRSRGKWNYVPNADTDFIYAIIGEELGFLGAFTVLLLFLGIAVGGTIAARSAPDPFGRLLAAALTAGLLVQAGFNMGSVVGLLPVTGVTLPLVSYGGSSLVFTMISLGLLLSIARSGQTPAAGRGASRARGRAGR
ncbi:MAG: putative lipid II flippase FtsW [Nitriliruptorales bacterium]|nr:putative lipid II flippase FtsW [Nitriliruptorales bacterium]